MEEIKPLFQGDPILTGTELDKYFEGFYLGDFILISGESGSGKTITALTFLRNALAQGYSGALISIDEPAREILSGARNLGLELVDFYKAGTLKAYDWSPKWEAVIGKKRIDPGVFIEGLRNTIRRDGVDIVVIDPIAPLFFYPEYTPAIVAREYIRRLVNALREIPVLAFATSEVPTGSGKLSRFGVEEFLSTGIIQLKLSVEGDEIVRRLVFRKLRWREIPNKVLRFEIVKEEGIRVE